jgi:hypothetical protein
MARERYTAQVELLVRALPLVAQEKAFALKGGTAINLFYRDMPRLSVDIDLTYLPLDARPEALASIDTAFDRILVATKAAGLDAQRAAGGGNGDTRLLLRRHPAEVKVEVSPVTRGTVFEPERRTVTEAVEDAFGFAEIAVVSFEDLFAGKICAALDRQHPRDLFDVKLLYENEGITDALFRTVLVYLACSPRPLHELVLPNRLDIAQAFVRDFEGMTVDPVPVDELLATREQLILDIQSRMKGPAGDFLRSVHAGSPDFGLIGLPQAEALPAIQWKLFNLQRLKDGDQVKYDLEAKALDLAIAHGTTS